LILRLIFINPMSLPVMTESYLRKDFHFGMYLGYCYGKALVKFFKLSLWSTLIFLGCVVVINLVATILDDDMMGELLKFACALTSFIMLLCMKKCLVQGSNKLVPHLVISETELIDPDSINLNLNINGIDPFS
jgi:hypothetical protein